MVKVFLIVLSLFIAGCVTDKKRQEHNAVYDEAALKEFVFTMPNTDEAKSLRVLDSVLAHAAADSPEFCKTVAFLEKAFGDPNSSYRNENLYSEVLQAKMKSPWCDSITRVKTSNELHLRMQNRPGTVANDFTYSTPAGYKKKVFEIKAKYTLLYFNNPDCNACREMKEALVTSNIINQKLKSGELKILLFHPLTI